MHDDTRVTTWWSHPREWRRSALASADYWVEEEVLVLVGDVLVDRLTWSSALRVDERRDYDAALTFKASVSSVSV